MKMIVAFITPNKAAKALDKLGDLGMKNCAVTEVDCVGATNEDESSVKMNVMLGRYSSTLSRLEFYCPDEYAQRCVEVICEVADTKRGGAGVVSVVNVEQLVRVRNCEAIND